LSRSLCHVHAASIPATIWTVNRFPPDLSRANDTLPVLMTSLRFRHFISGSLLFVSIGTYLTKSCFAFSVTLTTMAFDHSSLRWFEAYSCKPAPRGLPSSSAKHGAELRELYSFLAHHHRRILQSRAPFSQVQRPVHPVRYLPEVAKGSRPAASLSVFR